MTATPGTNQQWQLVDAAAATTRSGPAAPGRCWTCPPGRRRTGRRSCSTPTTAARTSCSGWPTPTAASSGWSTRTAARRSTSSGASTADGAKVVQWRDTGAAQPAVAARPGREPPPTLERAGHRLAGRRLHRWRTRRAAPSSAGDASSAGTSPRRHRGQQRRRWAQRADLAVRVRRHRPEERGGGVRAVLHRLRRPMAVDARRSTGMKAGDWLLIQFGINDGSTTCPRHVGSARYRELLTAMVDGRPPARRQPGPAHPGGRADLQRQHRRRATAGSSPRRSTWAPPRAPPSSTCTG